MKERLKPNANILFKNTKTYNRKSTVLRLSEVCVSEQKKWKKLE